MRRFYEVLLVVIICLVLFGCGNVTPNDAQNVQNIIDLQPDGNYYLLYFLNGNEFATAGYYTNTTDTKELVSEMLGEMGIVSDSMSDDGLPVTELKITKTMVSNGVAYIYFNEAYHTMGNVYEVLFRASVVKTLSQLSEVNYVYFYVGDAALTYDNGEIVGLMSVNDFIADSDSDLANLAWETVTLYFADYKRECLVPHQFEVAYVKADSKEKMVVEEVIKGPDVTGVVATVNSATKVIDVTVNKGVCYVNLDSSFMEEVRGIDFEMTVYSIVNSLCDLSTVDKVQFQINGDSHIKVNGMSFDTYYTKNLELTKREGTK